MAWRNLPIRKLPLGPLPPALARGRSPAVQDVRHPEGGEGLLDGRCAPTRRVACGSTPTTRRSRSPTTPRRYLEAPVPGAASTNELIEIHLRKHLNPVIGDVPLAQLRKTPLQNGSSLGFSSPRRRSRPSSNIFSRCSTPPSKTTSSSAAQATGLALPRVDAARARHPVARRGDRASPTPSIRASATRRRRRRASVSVRARRSACPLDRVDFLRRQVTHRSPAPAFAAPAFAARRVRKTPGSTASIPLPESERPALARHIAEWPSDDPDGLLFVTTLGARLRVAGWNTRSWKPAFLVAGSGELASIVPRLLRLRPDPREPGTGQSSPAGWATPPTMVHRTYAHLWRDDDERTCDAIDRASDSPDLMCNRRATSP